ncbi:MAG: site-specific integrase [Candidatus Obscuribacterales bacterium]
MNPFYKEKKFEKLRQGPLSCYLDIFASQLIAEGYGVATARKQLMLIAEFSSWLNEKRIQLDQLGEAQLKKFLADVSCKRPLRSTDSPALKRMLTIVQKHIISPPVVSLEPSAIDILIEEFTFYLLRERGVTQTTVFHYQQFVRCFLETRFAAGPVLISQLDAADVISFVRKQSAKLGYKRAKLMTCSLRSFLRFAYYKGLLPNELEAAVPKVVGWSRTDVPKALPVKHVAEILDLCDRKTHRGRRDVAILLLLSRLGLRAGEVVKLKLDDIDWELSAITICGKGGQVCKLPLPTDVGEAISDYIQNGRPQTNSRSIFFTVKAPIVPLTKQESVGHLVARLLVKAGIDTPRKGAHQLRHTLATEMLRQGSSLEEIGELLRHRSPQSTMIYAKVDLLSLQKLALPWPGGTP